MLFLLLTPCRIPHHCRSIFEGCVAVHCALLPSGASESDPTLAGWAQSLLALDWSVKSKYGM